MVRYIRILNYVSNNVCLRFDLSIAIHNLFSFPLSGESGYPIHVIADSVGLGLAEQERIGEKGEKERKGVYGS
jgi:hypothetical protein